MPGYQPSALAKQPGQKTAPLSQKDIPPAAPVEQAPEADISQGQDTELVADRLGQQMAPAQEEEFTPEEQAAIQQVAEYRVQQKMLSGGTDAGPNDERPIGFMEEFGTRAAGSMGRNEEEELSIIQRKLGKEKFTVAKRKGKIQFKKNNSSLWFDWDPEDTDRGDIADTAGTLFEGAANVLTEVGTIGAGFVAGSFPGAAASAILAPGVGAAAGVMAREAAVKFFEGEVSASRAEEMSLSIGMNYATLGMGWMLKGTGKKVVGAIKDALELSPHHRIKQLAGIRQGVEELASQIGIKTKTSAEAGKIIHDGVTAIDEALDMKMSSVREMMDVAGGGARHATENYRKEIYNQLGELGMAEDVVTSLVNEIPAKNGKKLKLEMVLKSLGEDKVYGDPNGGVETIRRMIGALEHTEKKGGMDVKDLFSNLDYLKDLSGYRPGSKEEIPDAMQAVARKLRHALAKDRNEVAQKLYGENSGGFSFIDGALKEYTAKMDSIIDLRKMFRNKKSIEKFTDALTAKDSSKQLANLKGLLGEGSEEFKLVQAEWVDKLLSKSIDPDVGIVSGKQLRMAMESHGEDVVNLMISPEQKLSLARMAHIAEKVPYMDILNNTQQQQILQNGILAASTKFNNIGYLTKIIWHVARQSADAAKYLTDKGLLEMTHGLKDPMQKRTMVKVMENVEKMFAATDIYTTKDGRRILKQIDFDKKLSETDVQKLFFGQQATRAANAGDVIEKLPASIKFNATPAPAAHTAAQGGKEAFRGSLSSNREANERVEEQSPQQ